MAAVNEPLSFGEAEDPNCLHCAIAPMVQSHLDELDGDAAKVLAELLQSMAEIIGALPERNDRRQAIAAAARDLPKLVAHNVATFAHVAAAPEDVH